MANINLKIPFKDVNYQTVIDAICLMGNYQDQVDDGSGTGIMIANPQTKEDFTIKFVKKFAMQMVKSAQQRQAIDLDTF